MPERDSAVVAGSWVWRDGKLTNQYASQHPVSGTSRLTWADRRKPVPPWPHDCGHHTRPTGPPGRLAGRFAPTCAKEIAVYRGW